jgi:hypothetical protein
MKIAQRFNAGFTAPKHFRAPSGAKEAAANPSSVPPGLGSVSTAKPSVETLSSDLLIPRLGAGATWNYPDTIPFGATLIINELWRVNLIGGVRNGFSHFPRDQEVWGYSQASFQEKRQTTQRA